MFTSKLALATSLFLITGGALADSGDLLISDWSPEAPTTREQVLAELREATRLGLITVGESDTPIVTEEQAALIATAGQDAAAEQVAKAAENSEG